MSDNFENGYFDNKVVLVTGSGSGIGRAIADAFAAKKAKVVVADINSEGGQQTAELINELGGEAAFCHTDLTQPEQVKAMVKCAVDTFGQLDVAVNNAGIPLIGPVTDYSEDEYDKIMDINLKAVWLCLKYEIPELLKQTNAAIVNTASIAGLVASPGGALYSASKFGVIGLTKSCALDYAKTGLRINAVCPGITRAPMMEIDDEFMQGYINAIPMGRVAEASEIAAAVVWLCSDSASYVTGHAMAVDGAFTVP